MIDAAGNLKNLEYESNKKIKNIFLLDSLCIVPNELCAG